MELTKLRIEFDRIIRSYIMTSDMNNHLWNWVKEHSSKISNLVENRVSQPSETLSCEQKCDTCNGWKKINDIYGECNTLRTSPYDYVIGEYEVENSEYETNQILTHKDFCCRLFANKR